MLKKRNFHSKSCKNKHKLYDILDVFQASFQSEILLLSLTCFTRRDVEKESRKMFLYIFIYVYFYYSHIQAFL